MLQNILEAHSQYLEFGESYLYIINTPVKATVLPQGYKYLCFTLGFGLQQNKAQITVVRKIQGLEISFKMRCWQYLSSRFKRVWYKQTL